MSASPGVLRSTVQQHRKNAGLGATELARRARITRQALHNIETGHSGPTTVVALRLAQALKCSVEELFSLTPDAVEARVIGTAQPGCRVRLARVGAGLLALPLQGAAGLGQQADGVVTARRQAQVDVELSGDPELIERTAILMGCDPSLELLAAHTARAAPDLRVLTSPASSGAALAGLAAGEAHLAGIHLWDAGSGESNLPFVRRMGLGQPVHVTALWTWEQGLLTAAGNPRGVQGVADLRGGGLRLINRDPGAGSRLMLDAWLDAAGFSETQRQALPGYQDEADSPLEAARRVQSGEADLAPGPRVVAQALGLHFIPLQTEHFDLIIPEEFLGHPAVQALLATARSDAFLRELATLGGYDAAQVGQLRGTVT
ncbi:substrate-binding domain-containing protein [Deinococcus arenicola]|uniref:Helix-turn-helix domain-containing protein n=1 Tax=Deinococcus arenicola TaxID=2994950 RepID=A0ABU4DL32_9DEIO|nr:substrate-binding domain-containing protein [Deinococcus sp. ZS9-10]MDV6373143.1 helix-turn-helix domain-containing protein [Deinococcus sp. ZS9-10]